MASKRLIQPIRTSVFKKETPEHCSESQQYVGCDRPIRSGRSMTGEVHPRRVPRRTEARVMRPRKRGRRGKSRKTCLLLCLTLKFSSLKKVNSRSSNRCDPVQNVVQPQISGTSKSGGDKKKTFRKKRLPQGDPALVSQERYRRLVVHQRSRNRGCPNPALYAKASLRNISFLSNGIRRRIESILDGVLVYPIIPGIPSINGIGLLRKRCLNHRIVDRLIYTLPYLVTSLSVRQLQTIISLVAD